MAFTLASSGGNSAGASSVPLTVTAAQGTLIAITAFGVATGNVAVALTSVTDNTSGGNTYGNIPAVGSSAFFAAPNQTSTQVTVWALVTNALSASTITVAFSGATFTVASYTVWSGIPAGTTVLSAALTASILANESSQAVPAVLSPAAGLAIVNVNLNGAVSSFSGGFTVVAPESQMGYLVVAAAGSVATTATFAGASDTWAVSSVIFGPSPASAAVSYGPGWHPGWLLPGLPGGTPFLGLLPPGVLTAATAIAEADAGSASDALSVSAAVALAESGSAAETLSVAASAAFAESGTSADALAASAAVALAEAGTAADALAMAAVVPLADAGSAADTLAAAGAIPVAEAGSSTASLAVTAAVPLAESGTGTDTLSVSASAAPALAESGTGTDSITVTATAALAESGTGADTALVTASVPLSDLAAAADALARQQVVAVTFGRATPGTASPRSPAAAMTGPSAQAVPGTIGPSSAVTATSEGGL